MKTQQYIIDWFKQFVIEGNEQELKFMREKARTGYKCDRYENCLFLHFFAAMSSTGKNLHVWEKVSKDITMPVSVNSNEWLHLTYLAEDWNREYEDMKKE